jgi:hypothetical protein
VPPETLNVVELPWQIVEGLADALEGLVEGVKTVKVTVLLVTLPQSFVTIHL